MPFHASYINIHKTWHQSHQSPLEVGRGVKQFLKAVGKDGEILEEPQSPRTGIKKKKSKQNKMEKKKKKKLVPEFR